MVADSTLLGKSQEVEKHIHIINLLNKTFMGTTNGILKIHLPI